jgi:WhiB family redox-sensing transcriptional regulator
MSLLDLAHLLDEPEWFVKAACRHEDSQLFFPSRGGHNNSGARARQICATCSVTSECLEYALSFSAHYDFGIYAGTNAKARRAMRRELVA